MKTSIHVANLNKNMIVHLKNKIVSYDEAISVIKQVAKIHRYAETEKVPIQQGLRRLAYETVLSKVDVPPFNNSAMDGYAINSANLENGQVENEFMVEGIIQAGDDQLSTLNNKKACKIMTGAPMPNAFDLVIPIERAELVSTNDVNGEEFIRFQHRVKSGDNVRYSGTDYQKGQQVCKKYTLIGPQHIMAMATTGHQQVEVLKKIPVAVISTGNELSEPSADQLLDGKIFNSNEPFLNSYVGSMHCQPCFSAASIDDECEFLNAIDQAVNKGVKIIISTGAVSMGDFDFIPQALRSIGAKIRFHKVKVRPGKPILFAELPNGIIYFGLSGNPIAAASGVRFFVEPFIRMMIGMAPENRMSAVLSKSVQKKKGFVFFLKAVVQSNAQGQLVCEALSGQGSFQTESFSRSNCWMVLGEDVDYIDSNNLVDVLPLIPNQLEFL